MTDNYAKIVRDNINRLYSNLPKDFAKKLPGEQEGERFIFNAFGEKCVIEPNRITLNEEEHSSVIGILISLYALNACAENCLQPPFKPFKEFPGSMPYVGAFTTHTEQLLVPHVEKIKKSVPQITKTLNGCISRSEVGGDFSFIVFPLPKIALCYIFYEADDDFTASTTCLFSENANQFMPIGGIADVGEYTSRKILKMIDW